MDTKNADRAAIVFDAPRKGEIKRVCLALVEREDRVALALRLDKELLVRAQLAQPLAVGRGHHAPIAVQEQK